MYEYVKEEEDGKEDEEERRGGIEGREEGMGN